MTTRTAFDLRVFRVSSKQKAKMCHFTFLSTENGYSPGYSIEGG